MKKLRIIALFISVIAFFTAGSYSIVHGLQFCDAQGKISCSGSCGTTSIGWCCNQGTTCGPPNANCSAGSCRTPVCTVTILSATLGYYDLNDNFVLMNGQNALIPSNAPRDRKINAFIGANHSNCTSIQYKFTVQYWGDGVWVNDSDLSRDYSSSNSYDIPFPTRPRNYKVIMYAKGDSMTDPPWRSETFWTMNISSTDPLRLTTPNPSGATYFSGTVTIPDYTPLLSTDGYPPSYHLLIGTNPSIITDKTMNAPGEIVLPAASFMNDTGAPLWTIDVKINNFTVPNLVPGETYYWRLRQTGTSTSGYFPGSSAGFTVPPDTTPPTSSITSPPLDGSWKKEETFSHTVSTEDRDPPGGSGLKNCEYRVISNGTEIKPWTIRTCSGRVNFTVGASGDCRHEGANSCRIEVRSTDNANNVSTIAARLFGVDFTPPVLVSFSRSIASPMSSDPIRFTATGTDSLSGVARYLIFVDAAAGSLPMGECSGSIPCSVSSRTLNAGAHTAYAMVIDGAGNSAVTPVAERSFNVTQAPLYVSYVDGANKDIKFAKSTDEGSSWTSQRLNVQSTWGSSYPSMQAVGTNVLVAYRAIPTGTDGDVMFIKSTNAGNNWTTPVLVDGATIDAGFGLSLDSPDATNIFIAYYERTNYDLKFAKSTDGGTSWTTSTVDSTGNMGANPSLKSIDGNTIFISYYDWTNGQLRFAKSTDGGTSWTKSNVAPATIVSAGQKSTSIQVGNYQDLYISFYTSTGPEIKLAKSRDRGGTWTIVTVPTPSAVVDRDISLSFSNDKYLFVSFTNLSDGHLYNNSYSITNNTWLYSGVDLTSGVSVGSFSSNYFTTQTRGYVTYSDSTNMHLKFALARTQSGPPYTFDWTTSVIDASSNVGTISSLAVPKSLTLPCSGTLSLLLNPSSTHPSGSVTPRLDGLANCSGMGVIFQNAAGVVISTCTATTSSSCTGSAFSIPSDEPSYALYNTISGSIDMNADGVIEFIGPERVVAPLTITSSGTNPPPAAQTSCGSGSARADGLVSTPALTGKFRTTGGCAIDSKTAFFPKLIKTFDDLESLYYTQK